MGGQESTLPAPDERYCVPTGQLAATALLPSPGNRT